MASPTRTIIYQPIFRDLFDSGQNVLYNTSYVQEHSMDFDKGLGGIFAQRGNNRIQYLSGGEKIKLAPQPQDSSRVISLAKEVFEIQNFVLRSRVDLDSAPKGYAAFHKHNMLMNDILIKNLDSKIKQR